MTWTDLVGRRPLLAVPLGSVEQHGPHLPLDTDTRIAAEVVARLVAARPDVVASPALPFGSSGEHAAFPGTLSTGAAALEEVLVELARSADHFGGVVWVCGHGGNAAPLARAVDRLRDEGRSSLGFLCGVPGGDAHAGRAETSMMLALAPDLVRLDRAVVGNVAPWAELRDAVVHDGVAAVSDTGILGDPTGAAAQEGESLLAGIAERLVAAVAAWAPTRRG